VSNRRWTCWRSAREKGLELGCLIDADTPSSVVGDPNRLNQILMNLVGNAIKFTDAGEVVVGVGANRLDSGTGQNGRFELHFAIRDTGIGIPPERMEHLFHPLTQADSSTSRRYGGTGLGLAISKRLAEMMGGRVWAESVQGRGSTFHFTIVAPAAAAAEPVYLAGEQPALRGKCVHPAPLRLASSGRSEKYSHPSSEWRRALNLVNAGSLESTALFTTFARAETILKASDL
jgi:hypothetical protein